MYLDTDIILAAIKKDDWLGHHVEIKKIKQPVTSALTIVEAQLVVEREIGRKNTVSINEKVKMQNIKIEPLTKEMLKKNTELLKRYENLNIFDSIHAAACLVLKENIISTDRIFDQIEGVKRIDPRELKKHF